MYPRSTSTLLFKTRQNPPRNCILYLFIVRQQGVALLKLALELLASLKHVRAWRVVAVAVAEDEAHVLGELARVGVLKRLELAAHIAQIHGLLDDQRIVGEIQRLRVCNDAQGVSSSCNDAQGVSSSCV